MHISGIGDESSFDPSVHVHGEKAQLPPPQTSALACAHENESPCLRAEVDEGAMGWIAQSPSRLKRRLD